MTFVPHTLADCKQSLADRHDNGVVPTSSAMLAKYVRLLNRGVDYCADKLKLTKKTTLTVASGVSDLPDDFSLVRSVFVDTLKYAKVDPEDEAQHIGSVYWITGNQVDGFVFNTPEDGDYVVNYTFKPSPLVNNTDICIIPDIEAPVAYAYAMLRKGESDPFEDAETSLDEVDARIVEMSSTVDNNSGDIGFTLDY